MITIEGMRSEIKNEYDSPYWKLRCETMPINQVIAVWHRLQERKRRQEQLRAEGKLPSTQPEYHQMTIFEYLREEQK